MKFSDIPKFPRAHYQIDVEWRRLDWHLALDHDSLPLNLEPDYQRGHVWSDAQRIAYVEYQLMGGEAGKNIITNCPNWEYGDKMGPYELVDGLQRITAARMFMHNQIKAFGHYYKDFEDPLRLHEANFKWQVMTLPTRADVLKLYLLINSGGVVHSPEEIERVRKLLEKEKEKEA